MVDLVTKVQPVSVLKRPTASPVLTHHHSPSLFCTPPPRNMLSDPASIDMLPTVAALSRGSAAPKRQCADISSTVLPPPPLHIPLHDDSLPGSVCSQHEVSSLSSKEDLLPDFAALTTPVPVPYHKLPSFREMFASCGELKCSDAVPSEIDYPTHSPRGEPGLWDQNTLQKECGGARGYSPATSLPLWTELNYHLDIVLRQNDVERSPVSPSGVL